MFNVAVQNLFRKENNLNAQQVSDRVDRLELVVEQITGKKITDHAANHEKHLANKRRVATKADIASLREQLDALEAASIDTE